MSRNNCYTCGYFQRYRNPDGKIREYCNDLDCTVDPYDPACNYND